MAVKILCQQSARWCGNGCNSGTAVSARAQGA